MVHAESLILTHIDHPTPSRHSGFPPVHNTSGWLIQRDGSIRSKSGFVTTHTLICALQLSWDTRHMLDTLQQLLYHTITETEQRRLQAVGLTCDLLLIALVWILLSSKLLDTEKLCHVGTDKPRIHKGRT